MIYMMTLRAQITCAMLWLHCLSVATADVVDTSSERAFSLAAGMPAVVVKRGDWRISREIIGTDGALKYELDSNRLKMTLNILILSNPQCKSADNCLDQVLRGGSERRIEIERFTNGPFAAVQYYVDRPNNLPVKEAQVIATALAGDCLIEVRVVKFSSQLLFGVKDPEEDERAIAEFPDMGPLTELIKSLSIRQ